MCVLAHILKGAHIKSVLHALKSYIFSVKIGQWHTFLSLVLKFSSKPKYLVTKLTQCRKKFQNLQVIKGLYR